MEKLKYSGRFEAYREELITLRRHFHQYPELGLKEVETSAFIRKYLEQLGYDMIPVAPTGLIASHPSQRGKEKLVVLRAEMDALPIQEKTGLPYASRNDGCMHACGHDAILATALVMAKILAEEGESFPVQVRFLFEPAEEIGEGAKRMLAAGALEKRDLADLAGGTLEKKTGYPMADAFVMFHYAVDQTLGMAVHEGQASAMINGMEIHVHGKSSHWCEASKGIDSIYATSLVVQAFHDINQSYVGKGPCLVGIGTIHGGEYPNIIADHVMLRGNIRACHEEDYLKLKNRIEEKLREIEDETGTEIEMIFPKEPVLAFANDPGLTELAGKVGKRVFGERFILEGEDELFLSGDNAYRYFQQTKGLFSVFLAGFPGENHPLHHPEFCLDEEILPYSLEALYEIIKETASYHSETL